MADMTLEEALAAATVDDTSGDRVLVIDSDLRTIEIPGTVKNLGVESDDDVHRLYFQMPKIYGEFDLSEFDIRINYKNGNIGDVYAVEDKNADGDVITFSWLVGRNAVRTKGATQFIVCLKKSDSSGVVRQEFNTTVASLNVLEGLETTEQVVQENTDIIEQILKKIDGLTSISPEDIATAVEEYMVNNPIEENDPTVPEWAKQPEKPSYTASEVGALPYTTKIPSKTSDLQNDSEFTTLALDETLTDNTKAAPAGMVGELKGDLSQLSEEIANLSGGCSGLSSDAKALLIAILRNAVYTSDQSTSITAFEKSLVSSGGSSGDSGSGETEVTLSGITATYSGGEVSEGTDVADLTGITVLAVYSNGSTKTVTGYTLTGEIAEGTNTITVSYGGMTTTFTVIGLAVFSYDDIAIGSTVNFNNSQMGISTSTGTINRATLIPIGQYLKKDKTYKISLGDASANYYYGVQIFVASVEGLVFEITGGQQSFDTVTTREIDTGWMQTDYEYTATDDNRIIAVNFKNSANGTLTESDREILLANVTVEEV